MFKMVLNIFFFILIIRNIHSSVIKSELRLDGRIVGGEPVNIQDIPFQVSLQYSYHFCGGSLIGQRYVLTAAHCTQGSLTNHIKVRIGSTYAKRGGTLVSVKRVHRHDKYDPRSIDYDFSILELENYNTTNLKSACVHLSETENAEIPDGTLLTVSGWGLTQNPNESNDALRATMVPKTNQEFCKEAYLGVGKITDRMLCAGYIEGGQDSCQGM